MTTETKKPESVAPENKSNALIKYENISDQVLAKINEFEKNGMINLPKSYSAANALKSAWLTIQETVDRNGKTAIEVCTKTSIANALLKMVIQGLSASKSQCYFIVYGNKLVCQRSYFGIIALAERTGKIAEIPTANIVYQDDEFEYAIDAKTGKIHLVKHSQDIKNINMQKIIGAYAITQMADGTDQMTVMTWPQIQAAWQQGQTKGLSGAHKNFPDEMAKKSVIYRACKTIVNSSNDEFVVDDEEEENDEAKKVRDTEIKEKDSKPEVIDIQDVDFEESVNEEPDEPEKKEAPVGSHSGNGSLFEKAPY